MWMGADFSQDAPPPLPPPHAWKSSQWGKALQEKCENYTRPIINHVYFFKHFFSFSIVVRQPHTRPLLPGDGERARSTATDSRRKGRRLGRHLEEHPPPSRHHHHHCCHRSSHAHAHAHLHTWCTSNSHPSDIFQPRSIQPLGKKLFSLIWKKKKVHPRNLVTQHCASESDSEQDGSAVLEI